jgi:hypothetical protein
MSHLKMTGRFFLMYVAFFKKMTDLLKEKGGGGFCIWKKGYQRHESNFER